VDSGITRVEEVGWFASIGELFGQ